MKSLSFFEKSLCDNARLFSLSKIQLDLFLLLQTNTLTYSQLFATRLHGNTEASARLAIKRLEKYGYVQSKILPSCNQTKYYCLTPKGRNLLKNFLTDDYLNAMHVDWERRPPSGNQQILHRIRTNDFYVQYISAPMSQPAPWLLESALSSTDSASEMPPRCDGMLLSPSGSRYYIEQDNSTQSETILLKKVNQYAKCDIFSNPHNTLVFCLAFHEKSSFADKPSFSIYKILLRFIKLWTILEEDYGMELDYEQFMQALNTSSLSRTISAGDLQTFRGLHLKHPDVDTLGDTVQLKRRYLHDTEHSETKGRALDLVFQKRLKSHFSRFYDNNTNLYMNALQGISLFAVPNHRLSFYLPHIMPNEHMFSELFLDRLLHSGLNIDGWVYQRPLAFTCSDQTPFYFRHGFLHPVYGAIAVELPVVDLSATVRLMHYFKNAVLDSSLTLVLVLSRDAISQFKKTINDSYSTKLLKSRSVIWMDVGHSLDIGSSSFHFFDSVSSDVLFECDEFDEKLHLVKGGAHED
ncbi:MAG: replication-relaxation family protein [Hespellia sp.]|nr:replication-relaxation family protein [Hespellia sp.]